MKALYIDNFIRVKTNPIFTQMWLEKLYKVEIAANFSGMKENDKDPSISYNHIDFARNPFHPRNIKAYISLLKLMRREKYDFIHCNSPVGGLLGRICGKRAKVPKIIYTAHGFHFYKGAPLLNWLLYYPVEHFLAHFTDAIITINQEDYERAQKFKMRKNGKVYYIPGVGVDSSVISTSSSKREELLKEIGADENSVLIISTGELNKNKNNEVIIKALGLLKNKNIHYILCGIGDKKDELAVLAKENNIENNIYFLGYRTDVPQLLKSCDIFAMPSFREGLSRSMMEAMAAGLPCIASNIRGNSDLIDEKKGGFLYKPTDVDGFADGISKLVLDKDLRQSLGDFNKEKVKLFDIENVKKIMADIYKNVLGDKR